MNSKKIFIASDHAGFDLKALLIRNKIGSGADFEIVDLGPSSADRVDYPDFAKKLTGLVLESRKNSDSKSFGVLICGSGQGMAMAANRIPGIRAALAWNEESARLSRAHNDANVLCLGARLLAPDLALRLVEVFSKTEFEGGRHADRIGKF